MGKQKIISTVDTNYFPVGENIKILDLGCGDGSKSIEFSRIFAEKGISVVAADEDNSGLKVLRDQVTKYSLKNIEIVRLKNHNKSLPFKSFLFDGVILCEVLEHIKDITLTLDELYRILKPNGVLCLSVPTNISEKFYYFLNSLYFEKAGHVRVFTQEEIIFLLTKHKFKISKIKKENFVFALFWLIASLLKINPSFKGTPERKNFIFDYYFKVWGLLHVVGVASVLINIGNQIFPKSYYFYAKK